MENVIWKGEIKGKGEAHNLTLWLTRNAAWSNLYVYSDRIFTRYWRLFNAFTLLCWGWLELKKTPLLKRVDLAFQWFSVCLVPFDTFFSVPGNPQKVIRHKKILYFTELSVVWDYRKSCSRLLRQWRVSFSLIQVRHLPLLLPSAKVWKKRVSYSEGCCIQKVYSWNMLCYICLQKAWLNLLCVFCIFTAGWDCPGTTTIDNRPWVWILALKICPVKVLWLELFGLGKLNRCEAESGNECGTGRNQKVWDSNCRSLIRSMNCVSLVVIFIDCLFSWVENWSMSARR